jgi:hypothetical protein
LSNPALNKPQLWQSGSIGAKSRLSNKTSFQPESYSVDFAGNFMIALDQPNAF